MKNSSINTGEQILAFSWKTPDTNKINLKEIRRYCDSRRTLRVVLFVFVLLLSYYFMTGLCGFISFERVALRSFVSTSGSEPWIPGCSTSVRRRSLAHLSSLLHTRHRGSDLEGMNITLRLIPAFRPLQVGGEVSHA